LIFRKSRYKNKFFPSRSKRSGKQDRHELCLQLIQFASRSEKIDSNQLLRNQQLQQDYQQIQKDIEQRINTLDDVRQELASLKLNLITVTTERDSLKMENEELIQNNQSLERRSRSSGITFDCTQSTF